MKRNDIILTAVLLIIAVAAVAFMTINRTNGGNVVVSVDGKEYKSLPLNKDTTLEIENLDGGINTLVIEDGYVHMEDANCPDKLCTYQKAIHYKGETIVCLPNKVLVTVESDEEKQLDAVAD